MRRHVIRDRATADPSAWFGNLAMHGAFAGCMTYLVARYGLPDLSGLPWWLIVGFLLLAAPALPTFLAAGAGIVMLVVRIPSLWRGEVAFRMGARGLRMPEPVPWSEVVAIELGPVEARPVTAYPDPRPGVGAAVRRHRRHRGPRTRPDPRVREIGRSDPTAGRARRARPVAGAVVRGPAARRLPHRRPGRTRSRRDPGRGAPVRGAGRQVTWAGGRRHDPPSRVTVWWYPTAEPRRSAPRQPAMCAPGGRPAPVRRSTPATSRCTAIPRPCARKVAPR